MASPTAAVIDANGITAPTFQQILDYLIGRYQSIFGADSYLGSDSQDYQMISVFAQSLSDANAACIAAYNSFSPATAQGAGLASNVKINGLTKLSSTQSVVQLVIVGVANITTITNGQAADSNGNVWDLPPSVTIPASGTITVQATCETIGAIQAAANTITTIQTAVFGWQTVNNPAAATIGSPIETDAALRVRQGASVSLPSRTIFEGVVAAIEQLVGVTRVKGYENNTNSTDANSIPAKNVAFIVEGGTASAIEQAIFSKLTPGIPMVGSTSATIVDANGSTRAISFSTPTDATISVAISLTALTGWSTATEAVIQTAMVAFLETLPIGANISLLNGVLQVATLFGTPYYGTYNITAITLKKNAGSAAAADIQLAYNEAAVAAATNITFAVS